MMTNKRGWRPRKRYNTYRKRRGMRIDLVGRPKLGGFRRSKMMEIERKWGSLRRSDYWFKHKV